MRNLRNFEKRNYMFNTDDHIYRQCEMTVMDNIADPDISFDESGISNYYYDFKKAEKSLVFTGEEGQRKLEVLINTIKDSGKGKQYDCIMGISGGVDSTYVAYLAKQYGLKPLAVHFDNGWNSELAVKNIENIVTKLDIDLHTLVVDWEEFKDLQLSYLKASVVDIEVVTDHAITATLFRLAKEHGIKYILSGSNVSTEYLMPRSWIFNKSDHINLLNIHKQFGKVKLKSYPIFGTWLKKYSGDIQGVKWVSFLNFIPYNKQEVKDTIAKELEWRDYGGKHFESIFTKFYQAYILPEKFKIDKRKPHLSNLICSGQISRDEALDILKKPLYPTDEFDREYPFVLKKLGLTENEFEQIMATPPRKHEEFGIEGPIDEQFKILKPFKFLYRLLRSK